jgi:hypothetical protein
MFSLLFKEGLRENFRRDTVLTTADSIFTLYWALRSWILTSLAFASTNQGRLWIRCARGCVAALVV